MRNIINGLRGINGSRTSNTHISLVKMKFDYGEDAGTHDILIEHIFISGVVLNTIKLNIVGAVALPTAEDFWNVFQNICLCGGECTTSQAQAMTHSERAACLWIETHKSEILDTINERDEIKKLMVSIFNIRKPCSTCVSFFETALTELSKQYNIKKTVEIIVYYFDENNKEQTMSFQLAKDGREEKGAAKKRKRMDIETRSKKKR